MTALSAAERAFLENPFVGVVTAVRPDGSPHSTVVWVDVDDDGVSFNTAREYQKASYLEVDPRITMMVVDPQDPFRWVSVSGTAAFVGDGANEQIDRLAKKFLGLDAYVHKPGETRVTVRISAARIESRGL